MTERRTATERHYLLADGTYRAEVHVRPIHYKAPNGSWQPIETSLAASTKSGYSVSNETNTIRTYLPNTSDGWMRVEAGGGAVSFRSLDLTQVSASAQESSVRYVDATAGVSRTYTVEPGRLKELITLESPVPAPTFRYEMLLEGLEANLGLDNSMRFLNATGEVAITIPAPWMKDAAGRFGRVGVSLTKSAEGLIYGVQPSVEWLAKARYPIIIDPVFTSCLWTAANLVSQPDAFWSPGAQEDPDDESQFIAGPEMPLGAGYYDCWRSVLSFGVYSLPRDSEISSARLGIHCDSATGDANKRIQAYRITKNLSLTGSPTSFPTPTNIGVTELALRQYDSSVDIIEPYYGGADKTFDVTGLLQDWADERGLPFNVLLRDTQEDVDFNWRDDTTLMLDADTGTLDIDYSTPGWYMLQCNSRHAGNTQYPLVSSLNDLQYNFGQKWTTELATASGNLPTNYEGAQFVPSIVAVPNYSNTSSGLPILYLPVNDKRIATWDYDADGYAQDLASGHTRIWRIEDTGAGFNTKAFDLDDINQGVGVDILVTGAPIVIGTALEDSTPGHKLIVAGIRQTVDESGIVDSSEGHVMRIDVTGSGQNAQMALKWDYVFDVSDNQQGVFASPGYWDGTTNYKNEAGEPRSYTGGVILVPVHKGDAIYDYGGGDYLIALKLDTENPYGENVWGYVNDSTGELDYHLRGSGELATVTWGGLAPLVGTRWLEFSSPAVSLVTRRVYATSILPSLYDVTGKVEARDLETGEPPAFTVETNWAGVGGGSVRAQTVSVLDNRFYAGRTGIFNGWLDIPGVSNNPFSVADTDISDLEFGSIIAPAAFYPKDHTAVVAASGGPEVISALFGNATDTFPTLNITSTKWVGDSTTGFTSGAPLITGTLGLTPMACLTTAIDDGGTVGQAHTSVVSLSGATPGSIVKTMSNLEGLAYSNHATYGSTYGSRARLYVVTGGIQQLFPTPFVNATQLYCFAQ